MKEALFLTIKLFRLPYVQKGFFSRVEELVSSVMDTNKTGEKKKKTVRDWLDDEYLEIKSHIKNLVIELVVFKLK